VKQLSLLDPPRLSADSAVWKTLARRRTKGRGRGDLGACNRCRFCRAVAGLELVQPPFSNLCYVWKQTFHPLHKVNQAERFEIFAGPGFDQALDTIMQI